MTRRPPVHYTPFPTTPFPSVPVVPEPLSEVFVWRGKRVRRQIGAVLVLHAVACFYLLFGTWNLGPWEGEVNRFVEKVLLLGWLLVMAGVGWGVFRIIDQWMDDYDEWDHRSTMVFLVPGAVPWLLWLVWLRPLIDFDTVDWVFQIGWAVTAVALVLLTKRRVDILNQQRTMTPMRDLPPVEYVSTVRVWGTPGGGVGMVDAFGEDNATAGSYGERYTATLLDQMVEDYPHAKIFHGLRFPGSTRADVDHAVVFGRTVLLIDSKAWKPAAYSWSPYGVLRDGKQFKGGDNHMQAAVTGFRELLETGGRLVEQPGSDERTYTVHAVVLLVPDEHDRQATVDGPETQGDVTLATPATLEAQVAHAASLEQPYIDRGVMKVMLGRLIDPPPRT